ncbi:polymer-forming cytoskeletal protein [candidate division KSB1 bacterium]|nr:polymer-forming cytoskeletal protein [candidate division KSB1 bacterium]
MFAANKSNDSGGDGDRRELNTIVGKGSVIEGKIKIKNSVRIDGKIKGEITSTGTVTIGSDGEVEGTINATNVIVGGRVRGKMNVKSKIILEKNSVLIGDLVTQKLNIAEGAIFDGNCIMDDKNAPVKPGQTKSDQETGK